MKQVLKLYAKPGNLAKADAAGRWPTFYEHPDEAKVSSTVAVTVTIEWDRLVHPTPKRRR